MKGEVGKETPKKEMDNLHIFMTSLSKTEPLGTGGAVANLLESTYCQNISL